MDDVLLDLVLARLDKVPLAENATALLLAACDSDASLSAQLSGDACPAAERSGERVTATPAGASRSASPGSAAWVLPRRWN